VQIGCCAGFTQGGGEMEGLARLPNTRHSIVFLTPVTNPLSNILTKLESVLRPANIQRFQSYVYSYG
jgi:hypothetical protein